MLVFRFEWFMVNGLRGVFLLALRGLSAFTAFRR